MTKPLNSLLVVDDDRVTCARLKSYFEEQGYIVSIACNGDEMWRTLTQTDFSLVLLDIGLPGKDGLELARELRTLKKDIGIILVTGRGDDIDRIIGLESGADDYVTKPFNSRELFARVKNLLRHLQARSIDAPSDVYLFSGYQFDIAHRTLIDKNCEAISLTRGEFEVLVLLVQNPGRVLSREALMHSISNRTWDPTDRTVDVLIRRLRGKIEPNPQKPELITTVRGAGYVFTANLELQQSSEP